MNLKNPHRYIEDALQAAVVEFLTAQYPKVMFYAIPNGEFRDKKTYVNKSGKVVSYSPAGARLKKIGVRPGVPDLHIAHPTKEYPGLFIELKSPHGELTPKQFEVIARLRHAGYKVEVCKSFDEAMEVIKNYIG